MYEIKLNSKLVAMATVSLKKKDFSKCYQGKQSFIYLSQEKQNENWIR